MSQKRLSYKKAGVDIDRADRLVDAISGLAKKTHTSGVRGAVGGYASLFRVGQETIAASTDGVGTKLRLAIDLKRFDTIGQDLVAMSVNDLLCVGSKPLFFLDYFAVGKLVPRTARQIIAGIARACAMAECALVGGETAEMPGFYAHDDFDLAGFAVGSVKNPLPRKTIRSGDTLIGVASSGFHSNGYSLLRKIVADARLAPGARKRLLRQLLEPTKIYVRSIAPLLAGGKLKGLAHITGSGLLNLPRVSTDVDFELRMPARGERPRVIDEVLACTRRSGMILSPEQWLTTFNMGIGMIAVTSPKDASFVLRALHARGERAFVIGRTVRKRSASKHAFISVAHDLGGRPLVLEY